VVINLQNYSPEKEFSEDKDSEKKELFNGQEYVMEYQILSLTDDASVLKHSKFFTDGNGLSVVENQMMPHMDEENELRFLKRTKGKKLRACV